MENLRNIADLSKIILLKKYPEFEPSLRNLIQHVSAAPVALIGTMELAESEYTLTPHQSSFGTLAAETELRHFLKLARPEWSKPRRRGRSDVVRVQAKLKAIGISDIDTLIKMVDKNTINEELYNRGYVPLSREALDSIRKQKTFMQALESVDVPNIRQVGIFDPVAQMLSRSSLRGAGARGRNSSKKGGAEETSSPAKTRLLRRPAIIQQEMDMPEDLRIPPWPRLRGVHHRRDRPKKNSSSSVGFMLPPHSEGDARRVSSCEEHTKSSRRQSHVKVLQRGKCIQATTAFCESRLHIASRQAGSFRVRSFRGTFALFRCSKTQSKFTSLLLPNECSETCPLGIFEIILLCRFLALHRAHGHGAGAAGANGVTNSSNGNRQWIWVDMTPMSQGSLLSCNQENVSNLANATYMQHAGHCWLNQAAVVSGKLSVLG
eukprot:s713_g19.t1